MKLKKDYTFDIRKDITGPCATVFDENRIGVWQMDVDGEVGQVKIEMTLAQAKSLTHDLALLLDIQKEIAEDMEDTNGKDNQ